MSLITVPKILRDKLTEQGADALVQIIDKVEDRSQKAVLELSEERFEKRVAQAESKLETRIAETRSSLETRIAQVETKLENKIAEVKVGMAQMEARLTHRMFLFWIGQFASIVGIQTAILFAFFKR